MRVVIEQVIDGMTGMMESVASKLGVGKKA